MKTERKFIYNQNTSTLRADYVGGIIGIVKATKHFFANKPDNIYIARDYNFANVDNYSVWLNMDSCYNSSNVYYEESSGEKTTDVAVASGIIGTYYGINKIKFDTCVNMGEIYSKSGSVGGIISSVEIGRAHV